MKLNYSTLRRKIIFFASIIGLIFLTHLIWVYIYEGGMSVGERGGSINIGIVWTAPEVPNPLAYTKDKYHDMILRFLYRPMITYDALSGEYQGDIGNCDIRDLSKIICEIKKDQFWSDGTRIQTEDIVATYQTFRAITVGDKMWNFLKGVSVVSRADGKIEITSKEKNSMILDLMTYPIVRSDMLERIKTGRISADGYITSWPYTFSKREKNTEYGYDRVTIERDEKNGGQWWLDKYHFLFFPDLVSLERSTDNLSVIIPPVKNEKLLLWPRFDGYTYTMYEYISLFMNTDTLTREVRQQLYGKLVEVFSGSIDKSELPVKNIFWIERNGTGIKLEKSLSDMMRSRWYWKPDESIAVLNQNTWLLTGSSINYGTNQYFTLPTNKKIFFTEIAQGEILLSGNIPQNTQKVFINDYELQEYRAGNTKFGYRVSVVNGTLKEWKNTYSLSTEDLVWSRASKDTLTIYYSTDSGSLISIRESIDSAFLSEINAPEKIAQRKKINEKKKEELKLLDPRYYYNEKNMPFELTIAYKDDPQTLEKYAKSVVSALENLSIRSKLVPISTNDLQKMLESWNKNYDMIIIGFEANGRLSRAGQVFLSTEAKNGINFSKIESKKLDALFAELRIAGTKEKTIQIQNDIIGYIESEAFFIPLSSPIHSLYIDKNLKWIKQVPIFQDISTLHTVLATASIKDVYMLNMTGKWFFSFFGWIWSQPFP